MIRLLKHHRRGNPGYNNHTCDSGSSTFVIVSDLTPNPYRRLVSLSDTHTELAFKRKLLIYLNKKKDLYRFVHQVLKI